MICYYPSCRFTAAFPSLSQRIKDYLKEKGVEVVGCCRKDYGIGTKDDIALTICTNCALILKERSEARVISVFEYLKDDIELKGIDGDVVIQHCFKADDDLQRAIEEIVYRSYPKAEVSMYGHFCGTNLMMPLSKANHDIAPKTFKDLEKEVEVLTKEEIQSRLQEMKETFKGKSVITYCNSCYKTLKDIGVKAYHIAELVFADEDGL